MISGQIQPFGNEVIQLLDFKPKGISLEDFTNAFYLQTSVQFFFKFHNVMFPCSSHMMDSLKHVGLDEKHAQRDSI